MKRVLLVSSVSLLLACGAKNEVTKGATDTKIKFVFDTAAKRPVGLDSDGVYIYESLRLETFDAGGGAVPTISPDTWSVIMSNGASADFTVSNDAKTYKVTTLQAPADLVCKFNALGEGTIEAIAATPTTPFFCYVNAGEISGLNGSLELQVGTQKATITGTGADQDLLWPWEAIEFVAAPEAEHVSQVVDTDKATFASKNPGTPTNSEGVTFIPATFTFGEKSPAIVSGMTIVTQPAGQTCTITTSGTTDRTYLRGSSSDTPGFTVLSYKDGDMTANVVCKDDAAIANERSIGGTVSGLSGAVTLQLDGANDLEVTEDGEFAFTTKVEDGATYEVTVSSQPSGQLCSVADGQGTATADVSNVVVTCVEAYSVGGQVTGLSGDAQVTLQNSSGDDLTVGNGTFTFATKVEDVYDVTVLTQPAGFNCTVTSGSGTATADITDVSVTCVVPATYTLGGTVSGIVSGDLILRDFDQPMATKFVTVTADGSFTFPGTRADGYSYQIDIVSNTTGLTCILANDLGNVTGANVTDITVTCN